MSRRIRRFLAPICSTLPSDLLGAREERVEKGGPLGRGSDALNPELEALESAIAMGLGLEEPGGLGRAVAAGGDTAAAAAGKGARGGDGQLHAQQDPFMLYLYGIVLSGRGRTAEALDALVLSLRSYPCNWSAWMVG